MIKRAVISILTISTLFAFLQSSVAFAEGVDFSIDVSRAALQLTVPDAVNISLDPTSSVADFDSTTINISVSTNSAAGYTLTMFPTSTTLSGTTSASIETLAENAEGYTEQSFTVNKWGYRILNNENYKAVPAVLSPEEWVTTGPANLSTKTLTLAAKVDGSQPADIYTTTLNFQVVANPNSPKDTIVFNGNGADSGSMASQFAYQGEPTKLNANAFVRDGYAFNGWNTQSGGLGTGYGDEDYYVSPQTNTATEVVLYAQWLEDTGGSGGGSYGRTLQRAYEEAYMYNSGTFEGSKMGLYVPHKNPQTGEYDGTYFQATQQSDYDGIPASDLRFAIQDIDLLVDGQKVCDRTTVIGSEAYVLDLRDYKSYWIAKLNDGKCWMTQNLDLDIDSTKTYTTNDTDLGWDASTNSYTYTEWTPASSTKTPSDGWTDTYTAPYSWDIGNKYFHGIGTYSGCDYALTMEGCDVIKDVPDSSKGAHSHVGNFYNWTASVALNNSSSYTADGIADPSTNPTTSICPNGWRLIDADSTSVEAVTLEHSYNIASPGAAALRTKAPLYFVYAGVVTGTISAGGNIGAYHVKAVRNGWDTWYFQFQTGVTTFFGSWGRGFGFSVRCIAR